MDDALSVCVCHALQDLSKYVAYPVFVAGHVEEHVADVAFGKRHDEVGLIATEVSHEHWHDVLVVEGVVEKPSLPLKPVADLFQGIRGLAEVVTQPLNRHRPAYRTVIFPGNDFMDHAEAASADLSTGDQLHAKTLPSPPGRVRKASQRQRRIRPLRRLPKSIIPIPTDFSSRRSEETCQFQRPRGCRRWPLAKLCLGSSAAQFYRPLLGLPQTRRQPDCGWPDGLPRRQPPLRSQAEV